MKRMSGGDYPLVKTDSNSQANNDFENHRADRPGLFRVYQLRGRVGRSNHALMHTCGCRRKRSCRSGVANDFRDEEFTNSWPGPIARAIWSCVCAGTCGVPASNTATSSREVFSVFIPPRCWSARVSPRLKAKKAAPKTNRTTLSPGAGCTHSAGLIFRSEKFAIADLQSNFLPQTATKKWMAKELQIDSVRFRLRWEPLIKPPSIHSASDCGFPLWSGKEPWLAVGFSIRKRLWTREFWYRGVSRKGSCWTLPESCDGDQRVAAIRRLAEKRIARLHGRINLCDEGMDEKHCNREQRLLLPCHERRRTATDTCAATDARKPGMAPSTEEQKPAANRRTLQHQPRHIPTLKMVEEIIAR